MVLNLVYALEWLRDLKIPNSRPQYFYFILFFSFLGDSISVQLSLRTTDLEFQSNYSKILVSSNSGFFFFLFQTNSLRATIIKCEWTKS